MERSWTTPQVSTSNPKDWFIWFRFTHNGQTRPIKIRNNINRTKDLIERKIKAEALCEARTLWLQQGWNPIADPLFNKRKVRSASNQYEEMTLCEAMEFAMDKKRRAGLAEKTLLGYNSDLERILKVGETTFHNYIKVKEFERIHVMEIIEACTTRYELSNHGYNKFIDVIRAMFTTLIDWFVVKHNPASNIKQRKVAESNKYESLTNSEKEAVYGHLITRKPLFLSYIQVLYYTGIRPKEILSLKVKDIRLNDNLIVIQPVISEENSKTINVRYVAINPYLKEILREMLATNPPPEHYLFGSCYSGGGNRGSAGSGLSGAMHPDYFRPSPFKVKRDTATKLWKKLIIDELGINKYMYALKHTGADDLILAGVSTDALKEMFGHTSKLTTEIYTSKVKAVRRSEIIEKAKAFAVAGA